MGRPREFDECEIVTKALRAFWKRGYDATSIEDLVEETGLGRASLYGAFGDKQQLFRRAVDHYLTISRAEKDRITAGLTGRKALEAFVLSRVASSTSKEERPLGCFLQMSATSGTSPALVEEAVASTNVEVSGWITQYLREAVAAGDLPRKTELGELTAFFGIVLAGLSASAKAGASADVLTVAAKRALELVFAKK